MTSKVLTLWWWSGTWYNWKVVFTLL
jgi:hypothetical protein